MLLKVGNQWMISHFPGPLVFWVCRKAFWDHQRSNKCCEDKRFDWEAMRCHQK